MAKKFLEGLVFGAGFGISFLAVFLLYAFIAMPAFVSGNIQTNEERPLTSKPWPSTGQAHPNFHELALEEQIKAASVIALVRYEPTSGGKVKAVVKEFLKKDSGVELRYNIGDEYAQASHYAGGGSDRGDGVIVFFVGSPAEMRMATTYSGDRIRGLGDIPLELFRDKCTETMPNNSFKPKPLRGSA